MNQSHLNWITNYIWGIADDVLRDLYVRVGDAADNIVGGPEHSTHANGAFPSSEFDFMLSNPPYGKSWKTDLERMGGKKGHAQSAFCH